jgi:hypothetical protein
LATLVSTRTAKNSDGTAESPLFFRSPNRREPRISAKNAISMADNSLPKQRKQQEGAMQPPIEDPFGGS